MNLTIKAIMNVIKKKENAIMSLTKNKQKNIMKRIKRI